MVTYTLSLIDKLQSPWARGTFALGINYSNTDSATTVSGGAGSSPFTTNVMNKKFLTGFNVTTNSRAVHFVPHKVTFDFIPFSNTPGSKTVTISARVVSLNNSGPSLTGSWLPSATLSTFGPIVDVRSYSTTASSVTLSLTLSTFTVSWLHPFLGGETGSDTSDANNVYGLEFSASGPTDSSFDLFTASSTGNIIRVDSGAGYINPGLYDNTSYRFTISGIRGDNLGLYCGIDDLQYQGSAHAQVGPTFGHGTTTSSGQISQRAGWNNSKKSFDAIMFVKIPEEWHELEQAIYSHITRDRPMSYSYYDPRLASVVSRSMHVEEITYTLRQRRMTKLSLNGLDAYQVGEGVFGGLSPS